MCPQDPINAGRAAPTLGLPNPIEHRAHEPPHLDASVVEKEAYERGVTAGRTEAKETNPYPEDSVQAKAYEHGYLDGQKIQLGNAP